MRLCVGGRCETLTGSNGQYEGQIDGEATATNHYVIVSWTANEVVIHGTSKKRIAPLGPYVTGVFRGRIAPGGASIADAVVAWRVGLQSGSTPFTLTWEKPPPAEVPLPESAPLVLNGVPALKVTECEGKGCDPLGKSGGPVWTFTGLQGSGQFGNGQYALTIEHLDQDSIAVRRDDSAGMTVGLKALYLGKIEGRRIIGSVVYYDPGRPNNPRTDAWNGVIDGQVAVFQKTLVLKQYSSPPLPLKVIECEGNQCMDPHKVFSIVWTLPGHEGTMLFDQRSLQQAVVEHLDGDLLFVRRIDAASGFSALYMGKVEGKRIIGSVLYYEKGRSKNPNTDTWFGVIQDPGSQALVANYAPPVGQPQASAPTVLSHPTVVLPPGSVPTLLAACEDTDGCSNWHLKGTTGHGEWPGGGAAQLTVEQFDARTVVIRRLDISGTYNGLSGQYSGTRKGDWIEGFLTWTWPGHGGASNGSTPWHAIVAPPLWSESSVKQADRLAGFKAGWAICEDAAAACEGPKAAVSYLWDLGNKQGEEVHSKSLDSHIELTIDHLDATSVTIRRVDLAGPTNGVTRIFSGVVQGTSMKGSLISIWPGHANKPEFANWVARAAPKNCEQSEKQPLTVELATNLEVLYLGVGDKANGFRCALWAAQQGDANAEAEVGSLYLLGLGTPKDPDKATVWLSKSADQGNVGALQGLSYVFRTGLGRPVDMQRAQYFSDRAELAKVTQKRPGELFTKPGGQAPLHPMDVLGNLLRYSVFGQAGQDTALIDRVNHEEAVLKHMQDGMSRIAAEEKVFNEELSGRVEEHTKCAMDFANDYRQRNGSRSADEVCQTDRYDAMNQKRRSYVECVRANSASGQIEVNCHY